MSYKQAGERGTMRHLNGWQRLWAVLTLLWLAPFGIALVAFGLPTVYAPPKLASWTMTCGLKEVVERLISNGESDADIRRVIRGAEKENVLISFWRPEGDKSDTPTLYCNDAALVYNPESKQKELAVFARLDQYGDFRSGFDVGSALADETTQRIELSKRVRRNSLRFGIAAALGFPTLLYAFGASVAWIRRGFKPDHSTAANS